MNDLPQRLWLDDAAIDSGYAYTHDPCNSFTTEYIRADTVPEWQPIDEFTPSDVELVLGWRGFSGKWETCVDYWHNTRGGWFHGSATHCMPIPTPPKE